MLDFVLTFSLPKLVFDNEVCGQCLHFVRNLEIRDDLPTGHLVEDLMREDHLITSPHTLEMWPRELYLTNPVIDRANRDKAMRQLIIDGLESQDSLPELPPPPEPRARSEAGGRRRRRRRSRQ